MKNKLLCMTITGILAAALALGGCGASSSGSSASADSRTSTEAQAATASGASDSTATVDTEVTGDNIGSFIALGTYKGLDLARTVSTSSTSSASAASSDDSMPAILSEISSYTINYPDDTKIVKGMTVNIDYAGTIDGTAFDGGTAEGTNLKIGSNTFISGFEDQLVGHVKGDKVTVKVTFPTDYGKAELAGKAAEFAVTINGIRDDPWTRINDASEVLQYPKSIIDLWTKQITATYSYYAATYSMDMSSYMAAMGIRSSIGDTAKMQTKSYLVSEAILHDAGITKDSEEYKTIRAAILKKNGYDTDSAALAAGLPEQQIDMMAKYYTAYEQVIKNAASVTEK